MPLGLMKVRKYVSCGLEQRMRHIELVSICQFVVSSLRVRTHTPTHHTLYTLFVSVNNTLYSQVLMPAMTLFYPCMTNLWGQSSLQVGFVA